MERYICKTCQRHLKNQTGLTLHSRKCLEKKMKETEQENENPCEKEDSVVTSQTVKITNIENLIPDVAKKKPPDIIENQLPFTWGEYDNKTFEKNLDEIYENIVFWRKNIFMLPTGKAGKSFIEEITRLLNSWTTESVLERVAFKAIMVMPSLLLQKPNKSSKAKEHSTALERRIELWKRGDLIELLKEGETIQNGLKSINTKRSIAEISKRFAEHMQKGNVNSAIKLLTNKMQNGILPLNDQTLQLLKQKHPKAAEASKDVLLPDIPEKIHEVRYEGITAESIRRAAVRTKGGAGPSNMDADGWKRMLTSNSFGSYSTDLCKAIAEVVKKLSSKLDISNSLEAFLACRLIPLDKNPGLRPIGVGEVLRRIIGKVLVSAIREDIVKSVGSLQVCAGQEAGCEAAVHAMHDIFNEEQTEAVLLIDAANAFNALNRKVFLHNISIVCPAIATFVGNCYNQPSRLFVIGGVEITSSEGTTQGDPIAMVVYATAITPLLLMVIEILHRLPDQQAKTSAFADDFSAAGTVKNLLHWWEILCQLGPKFGYFPEPSKCWLIVKPHSYDKAISTFQNTGVKTTKDGKRHLGAVIGTDQYREEYIREKIDQWKSEITTLTQIAQIEPQAAYSCFIAGYKNKFTYYMRTVPAISNMFREIDNMIDTHLIPAITGGRQVNETERKLLSLPCKYGGLGIPICADLSEREYVNSRCITENLRSNIISQQIQYVADPKLNEKKNKIKADKHAKYRETLDAVRHVLNDDQKRLNEINQETGASTWLTTLPIKSEGYVLNKQCFWDLIRIRYGWDLSRLPETCECGSKFSIEHGLSCKKGGFISLRHNQLRNITARLLQETCRDVRIEPSLQQLTGETFAERTANIADEARVDVSARGFWITGQTAFLDVRVFNPMAKRHVKQSLAKCYEANEKEKKRKYNERILAVEHGSFTPLVFSAMGGMGREAIKFYKRLADDISAKRKEHSSFINCWVRRKISFALINSVCMCIRGSRSIEHTTTQNLSVSISHDPKASEVDSRILV